MDENNKNNSPNGWTDGELNDQHEITLQRMKNQMVGMKITHPRVGEYKNNSPEGWEAQKITRQRDGRMES